MFTRVIGLYFSFLVFLSVFGIKVTLFSCNEFGSISFQRETRRWTFLPTPSELNPEVIATENAVCLFQNYLLFIMALWTCGGFPCGSAGKQSTCNVGDLGSIPGLGRSPGEGKGYPLQSSGLENSMNCIMGSQRVGHD